MPKGRVAKCEFEGSLVADLRQLFLFQIRSDVPQALEALRECVRTDGSNACVEEWAATWRLTDEWLLNVAQDTAATWRRIPKLAEHLQWSDVILNGELIPEPPSIRWYPTVESESDFSERVIAYIADVRTWVTE